MSRLRHVFEKGQTTEVHDIALSLASVATELLQQTDTFYHSRAGRLKLRTLEDGQAELIAYSRANQSGPKLSSYVVHSCTNPGSLHEVLAQSLGVRGVVRKTRRVVHIGQTRVHLDEVSGLGDFLELEVVLGSGATGRRWGKDRKRSAHNTGNRSGRFVEGRVH